MWRYATLEDKNKPIYTMKKILFAAALLASTLAFAQQDAVLMTIDGKPVMASEFLYIYNKNNQESALEKKTMREYLDLFVNFKLKVTEAEAQGIDTTAAFRKELAGYRAQATPRYMVDNEAVDSLIRMSYDRLSRDRRAAHIAVECHADAPDSAVEAALAKINEARVRVTTGLPKKVGKGRRAKTVCEPEEFGAVALEMSSDPNVQENHGELGWITPFRYVYAFEDAVYNTPVGQVTPVFRSGYGFHIALVEEERPHEEVNAAHIMKMVPRDNDSIDAVMKHQIDSIYVLARSGAAFGELAQQLSDDKGSAMRGGELGWFGRGYMVPQFEAAAFALRDSGEISEPVRSRFGWHIIRLNGHRPIQSLDEMRPQIERNVQRDERIKQADLSFLRKTRAEYQLPDTMSDEAVRASADAHLEEKYEDLRHLVREYHDGILLFDVSLREVWDKAAQDVPGLTDYFRRNKKQYTWDQPRFKGYVVYCKDQASARAARSIIRNSPADSIDSFIAQRINLDSVTYVRSQHGLFLQGQNPAVDKYGFRLKEAAFEPDAEFPVVFTVGKVLKAPAEYTDERGKVTTDYQDYLEKQWVEALRAKYPVVIDEEVFRSLQ